jgi:heptose I phosphotransferase
MERCLMSDGLWQRLVRGSRRVWQRTDWAEFVGPAWADYLMTVDVTDRFHAKQGRSTGRWILQKNGRRLAVYLKRHYRLSWGTSFLATVLPRAGLSPAFQELRHLQWAARQGLPVPDPVAAAEYTGPWCRLQSVLAVAELVDMLPLNEAIPIAAASLDTVAFSRWKSGLVGEMARLARLLHRSRRFHKDFYLCHFYVHKNQIRAEPGWRGQVYLIDLHRLRGHFLTAWLWRAKDLAQLLYSSDVLGVTPRDRLRFWAHYWRSQPRSWRTTCLQWLVMQKWRSYRRHKRRSMPVETTRASKPEAA